jgi:hypothetical protein
VYELRNTPWYAYGVSFGDRVCAPIRDGMPTVTRVVERGGHYTLRAFAHDLDDLGAVIAALNERGCAVETESSRATYMAIDVPPGCDLAEVERYLRAEQEAGRLEFEEASVPQP